MSREWVLPTNIAGVHPQPAQQGTDAAYGRDEWSYFNQLANMPEPGEPLPRPPRLEKQPRRAPGKGNSRISEPSRIIG